MLWWMRRLPPALCEAICLPASVAFFLAASAQRRAVFSNLDALHPHLDSWTRWCRAASVFHQFALVYMDRLYHLHFAAEIEWELPDASVLRALEAEPCGALLFTAHSGNYDIGATLFAAKFGRPLHIVRVPERSADLQKIRAAELRQIERQGHLHVHYNNGADLHLGMELCRLLTAGEVVAVQGDRVVLDVAHTEVIYAGRCFHLPKGPLVLAEVTHCPCYAIFLTRSRRMVYRVHVSSPFVQTGERLKLAQIAERWLAVLHPFVTLHTDQWFVFEPLVKLMLA